MKRSLIAVLALAFAAASAAWADDAVLLQYKFVKGDKRTYSRTQGIESAGGPPNNTAEVVAQEVRDVTDAGASIARTVKQMKVSMDNQMMGHVEFDSTKKEDLAKAAANPILMSLTLLLNKPIMVQLSNRGEVKKVELDEALAPLGPMAGMLKGTMEEAIKQTYLLLPEKPVKPGESWSQESKLANPALGMILQKYQYTYSGTEDHDGVRCAKIQVKASTEVQRPKKNAPEEKDDLTDEGKNGKKDGKKDGEDTGTSTTNVEGTGTIFFALDGYIVDSDVVLPQAGAKVRVHLALVKE